MPQVSRGLAVGDLFNRGRLDVVVENLTGGPMILEAKSNPANHWVSFDLEGSPQNRLALNARVRVTTGKLRRRWTRSEAAAAISRRAICGCTSASAMHARIDKVEVLWPNGGRQVFESVASDRFYHLKQGGRCLDKETQEHRRCRHVPCQISDADVLQFAGARFFGSDAAVAVDSRTIKFRVDPDKLRRSFTSQFFQQHLGRRYCPSSAAAGGWW